MAKKKIVDPMPLLWSDEWLAWDAREQRRVDEAEAMPDFTLAEAWAKATWGAEALKRFKRECEAEGNSHILSLVQEWISRSDDVKARILRASRAD